MFDPKKKFKIYPIGFFHIDIAEVRTEEGKLHLFVAIDRTSKFAFVELHERTDCADPALCDRCAPIYSWPRVQNRSMALIHRARVRRNEAKNREKLFARCCSTRRKEI
jgi:hypothetical protein